MMLYYYISIKFHKNILISFQVIEQTRNDHCQISKNNSKNVLTRVMVIVVLVRFCDRWTDNQGKTIHLHPFIDGGVGEGET